MTKRSETLEMATLYRSGMTLRQIADLNECKKITVYTRLLKFGIKKTKKNQ